MYPPAAGLVGVVFLALSKNVLNELQSVQQEQNKNPGTRRLQAVSVL